MTKQQSIAIALLGIFALTGVAVLFLAPKGDGASQNERSASEPSFRRDGHLEFLDAETREPIVRIDIEMADEAYEQAQGLKHRSSMGQQQGMLFVFAREGMQSFWMQDTKIPLDICYVGADLRIVNIVANAEPMNETRLLSSAPAQFVVEVNGGFCAEHGIEAGDYIRTGPE